MESVTGAIAAKRVSAENLVLPELAPRERHGRSHKKQVNCTANCPPEEEK
jgi:hypothetical protein